MSRLSDIVNDNERGVSTAPLGAGASSPFLVRDVGLFYLIELGSSIQPYRGFFMRGTNTLDSEFGNRARTLRTHDLRSQTRRLTEGIGEI